MDLRYWTGARAAPRELPAYNGRNWPRKGVAKGLIKGVTNGITKGLTFFFNRRRQRTRWRCQTRLSALWAMRQPHPTSMPPPRQSRSRRPQATRSAPTAGAVLLARPTPLACIGFRKCVAVCRVDASYCRKCVARVSFLFAERNALKAFDTGFGSRVNPRMGAILGVHNAALRWNSRLLRWQRLPRGVLFSRGFFRA